ncbi:DUF418 domain-containing protein [Jiulongibacter sp. NS-SX5]|uniref:DUF418 domain-containing protein n=1 Tax=Jiulongibacter sp. NS-SX5 TaxID=3463854 RepID=UPI004058C312
MEAPARQTSRIDEIDALRGLALLGILVVNIFIFHAPYSYYGEFYGHQEGINELIMKVVSRFFAGKFLFIFAFLFGFGAVLQQQTLGHQFPVKFRKRMFVLLVFGLLHTLFFWFGDILCSYALLGLLLIPVMKLKDDRLLKVSVLCFLFIPLYYFAAILFDWSMVHMGRPMAMDKFIEIFQTGSYMEILKLRMKESLAFLPENLVWYIPKTFGLFLLGVYTARKNLLRELKKFPLPFLIIGLTLLLSSTIWQLYKVDFFLLFDLEGFPIIRPFLIAMNETFGVCMGFGYTICFLLAFQKNKKLALFFAKPGRMSLTIYIAQSLICVLLFYGFGLGLYGQLTPLSLVGIATAIYLLLTLFSTLYLKVKRHGPLEIVWRKLSKNI